MSNFQLRGNDPRFRELMGAGMFTRIATRAARAATSPKGQAAASAIPQSPAGELMWSLLPGAAKTVVRKGVKIVEGTKADITKAVQKSAQKEVSTKMTHAGLIALGVVGLGAGFWALSRKKR